MSMDYLERGRRVFEVEIQELERLSAGLGDSFSAAVSDLAECREAGHKIITLGIGKCSHIADKIAATMTSTGTPAVALNSMNALHGDLGIVQSGDVVLALSFSGETEELLNLLSALKRFDVRLIAITGNGDSSLARHADVVLDLLVEREACPLELAPTSSTTCMLVLGDALAMVLLEEAGFGSEDFARYHPAGTLGRKLLLRVSEIMRKREGVAVVAPEVNVPDVLEAMTRQRSGAAIVEGADGRLAGIFTHGDFVRSFRTMGA
ncbi:MAG: KpsF/GutQ family sugar-phosphate isomerase, partial [Verrucomicrobiota bacterium]